MLAQMLLFCFLFGFFFFLNSPFFFLCVCGEAVGMRNECKVLVRIKKGYGWQLEEDPKIAGAVSLLGSSGWDQGGSRGWNCSSCCGEGGWGQSALQGDGAFLFLGRTRGLLRSGVVLEKRPCQTELQKLHSSPTTPSSLEILYSAT